MHTRQYDTTQTHSKVIGISVLLQQASFIYETAHVSTLMYKCTPKSVFHIHI